MCFVSLFENESINYQYIISSLRPILIPSLINRFSFLVYNHHYPENEFGGIFYTRTHHFGHSGMYSLIVNVARIEFSQKTAKQQSCSQNTNFPPIPNP